ncbi:hypothetical protein H0H81_011658 [Sphagnurus paluster]|uniref:F-box domain-containing protein n=1 Tax=Sphagnurus paluster TaxID=117069 RepID=A0A9P7KJC2_9AGAR|nr:hypothetical protein H0H81_011658 [Sphagnurus paluster]
MHPCLAINEILSNVFAHLFEHASTTEDDWTEYSQTTITLAALARTCRTFTEPALDHLWEVQVVFAPLVQCMPADLWHIDPATATLKFIREIRDTDWDRFDFYARRVREMGRPYNGAMKPSTIREVDSDALAALAVYRPARLLLPHLQVLQCTPWSKAILPVIHFVAGDSLRSVVLRKNDFLQADNHINALELSSFLLALSYRSTSLTSLSIFFPSFWETRDDGCLQLLSRLPKLRHITISPIFYDDHRDLVEALARLPSLEELFWPNVKLEDLALYTTYGGRFPQLRAFGFYTSEAAFVGPVLSSMQREFSQISVTGLPIYLNAPSQTAQLDLTCLPTHPARLTLTKIHIYMHLHLAPTIVVEGPGVAEVLAPLFALTNVREVTLELHELIALTDAWFADAANAWPALEDLTLVTHSSLYPAATLAGLAHLARRCVQLGHVAMWLDARVVPAHEYTKSGCQSLSLDASPIADPLAVVLALCAMFPELDGVVGGERTWTCYPDAEMLEYDRGWMQVEQYILE